MKKTLLNYWGVVSETKQYPIVNDANGKYVSGGGYYQSDTSQIRNQKEIEGETDIDLFETFYKLNNSLRYCNGSYYKFVEKEMEDKYANWLKSDDYKAKSFNLYYGNGVVD
jgi:hypothetical protein